MDTDVVEVVARFGGTILDVRHVGPTDTYLIGTAQGTHLSVPGLTCFPLVARGSVRLPLGLPAVERDGWTELRVGELSLFITRTKLSRVPLARPRFQWKPPAFIAASLLAHLAIWLLALTTAPFERLDREKPQPRLRYVHVDTSEPVEPKPEPSKPEEPKPAKESVAAVQPRRAERVARDYSKPTVAMGMSAAEATRRLAQQFDQINVEKHLAGLDPKDTYIEDDANARGFGGSRGRFDPTQREGWGTVETGRYATMIYDVKLCPKRSCTVEGPIPALFVRTHLHHHMDAIYDCYVQHASGPGTIVLTFTITPDGAVRDARGRGLGETGACAARVAGEIFFKALGNDWKPPRETRVRYPVRFEASQPSESD
ncbi:MAG TPA: hypothetical protein VIV11_29865 [Kofleriaceae bacterium]